MNVAVYLPLLLAIPLSLASRYLAARGSPASSARTLAWASVVVVASSTWSLVLLALTLFDDVPPLAALDNRPTLELPEPVPGPVALAAALVLGWGGVRLVIDLRPRIEVPRQLRSVGVPFGGMVVANSDAPIAIAVPGRPGHLLVSSGMLRLLDRDERQVLFAHEQAHLTHHHHGLVTMAATAAALNPLLIPVRNAVDFLAERWADEDAAAAVADRRLVARAVAKAALATRDDGPTNLLGLGMHGGPVVRRVRALVGPAPAARRHGLIGPVLLSVGCLVAIALATVEFVVLARAWLII
jgi:Zn-dependent protease with chaperone function